MSIAVVGSSGRVAVATARFAKAGMVAVSDRLMSRRSPSYGAVLHVARSDRRDELLEFDEVASELSTASRSQLATRTALRKQRGAFQPVWMIYPVMRPLGFELLAVDDDDASEQTGGLLCRARRRPVARRRPPQPRHDQPARRLARLRPPRRHAPRLSVRTPRERQKGGENDCSKPAIHTVPHGDGWANRTEGATRVFGTAPTKDAAEQIGRDSAGGRHTEHISHRRDGTIGERRS